MKAFHCTCRQPLFFDNNRCLRCGSEVAYDPTSQRLTPLKPAKSGRWLLARDTRKPKPQFRFCANRTEASACNWLVPADSGDALCLSCQLTRTIPILARPKNPERLRELEAAKRRVLFVLQELKLPLTPKSTDPERGLAFDFLESLPGEPRVLTGHAEGLITLNVAEADDDYRERHRDNLREPYRTVIGHLRHELAHYYWDLLIRDTPWLEPFRKTFGDERTNYAAALELHYADGPAPDWRSKFISAYAASHPWEDWAESWAHYLHLKSTLETVQTYGLNTAKVPIQIEPFGLEALGESADFADAEDFLRWINAWVVLTTVLNEVSRSMGQPDLYPFVLNGPAVEKLYFVHRVILRRQGKVTTPPPPTLAQPVAEAEDGTST
ncbi:MAG: putative zinc-binding peptidase [Verrucomicrobiales bacterium]|nr:putative zinc-binding peptidase [Verrucomicrobiales bacterium]